MTLFCFVLVIRLCLFVNFSIFSSFLVSSCIFLALFSSSYLPSFKNLPFLFPSTFLSHSILFRFPHFPSFSPFLVFPISPRLPPSPYFHLFPLVFLFSHLISLCSFSLFLLFIPSHYPHFLPIFPLFISPHLTPISFSLFCPFSFPLSYFSQFSSLYFI